jgi:hypothetical protein
MVDEPISMPDSSAPLTEDGAKPAYIYFSIFQRLVERFNRLVNQADDTDTGLGSKAAKEGQTDAWHGLILVPANTYYPLVLKAEKPCRITEITTQSTAGTCTATFAVNGMPIGTANSVSTTEQSIAHNSLVGQDQTLSLTISANAACLNMSFSIKYTYDLV